MNAHLRANLWLLVLTVLLCCVCYPFALWLTGRGFLADKASGSLIDKHGKPTVEDAKAVGSRLIAQPFNGRNISSRGRRRPPGTPAPRAGRTTVPTTRSCGRALPRRSAPSSNTGVDPKGTSSPARTSRRGFRKTTSRDNRTSWPSGQRNILSSAQAWVKADKLNGDFVSRWQDGPSEGSREWVKNNPETSRAETRRPRGTLLRQFFPYASGVLARHDRGQDAGRQDREAHRAGDRRHGHSAELFRYVASGASRCGPR